MATNVRRRKGSPGDDDSAQTDAANEFLVHDGRIVLSPSRPASDERFSTAYEAVATPPPAAKTTAAMRKTPSQHREQQRHNIRQSTQRFAASHQSLPPTGSAYTSFHDVQSHRASERSTTTQQKASNKSARSLQMLRIGSTIVFALSLLVAIGARASIVSLFYLVVFCAGVVWSFESRALTFVTLVVAVLAAAAHAAVVILFAADRLRAERWTRTSAASLFGLYDLDSVRDYFATIGVDVLVAVVAAFHAFYVLAKLKRQQQQQQQQTRLDNYAFDFFELVDNAGAVGVNQPQPTTAAATLDRRIKQRRWLERLCSTLLFVTALSRPAIATGIYFILLLLRLINWTFWNQKVTLAQLVFTTTATSNASTEALFLGPRMTKLLLGLSVLITTAWYVFQLDDVRSNATVQDAALYIGVCDFRAKHVSWSCYVFASSQFLLLLMSAVLWKIHAAIARDRCHSTDVLDATENTDGMDQAPSVDIAFLLKTQPFIVRVFLQEGGLLLASAAAIVWCVSYPSYASLPLLAWAFLSLALYGLASPPVVIWVLIVYGTALSITEYMSNLAGNVVISEDVDAVAYGLKAFDYPFLDLSVHNICLVFIYYSIRTRWQYQDVLRELQRQQELVQLKQRASETSDVIDVDVVDAGMNDGDNERATMADLRLQADMLNQMKGGYGKILELWVLDAKQVVATHLDGLVLLIIVAVAISTRVSFLQIGYLVLAVLLMFFFEHRRRFWRVLLYYALGACLAVFVRNIDCSSNSDLALVGLECYSSTSETWGSLYPTLFLAQLLIIVLIIIQLVIYVTNKDTIDERLRTQHQARQHPLYFLSRLALEVDNMFRTVGVVVCYVALVVVAVESERGTSRLNTNLVGTTQLVVLVTLLGTHLGGLALAPKSSFRMKILWSLALLVQIGILIARYVYQFAGVASFLDDHVFTPAFMTARDCGLEDHASSSGLSGVFIYLLPTAIVMALCFWQLASLLRTAHAYDLFAVGRSRRVDQIRMALEALQQVLTQFSTTAVVIVAMYAALDDISLIGALYVLVLVGGRPLAGSWKNLWLPLFWLSAVALVLKYAIQLDVFRPDSNADAENADGTPINTLFRTGDSSDWVGLVRLPERIDASYASAAPLWTLLSRQLLVMLMCCIQRVAQYFDATVSTVKRQQSDDVDVLVARFESDFARQRDAHNLAGDPDLDATRRRTSSVEAFDDDDDREDRFFQHDVEGDIDSSFVSQTPRAPQTTSAPTAVPMPAPSMPSRRKRVSTRFAQPSATPPVPTRIDQDDFVACFRDFCVGYASRASVNVVMLLLTISCFVRQDVVSVVYMLVVYGLMYARAASVCARWYVLAALLSVVIVLEYAAMLWFPPPLSIDMQDIPPWSFVPLSHQQWFVLSDQHKWGLMTDFVALLSVYLLPETHRLGRDVDRTTTATAESSGNGSATDVMRRTHTGNSNTHDDSDKVLARLDGDDYELRTRQHVWYWLEFTVLCAWLPLLLVLVFVLGASQGGLASLPYLIGAMLMLARLDDARQPASPWIQYLRKWNWAHLFVIVVLQAPYFKTQFTNCRLGSGTGADTDGAATTCLSIANILGVTSTGAPNGLIAIFVLLSIQCEMLAAPAYQDVLRLLEHERQRAPVRREEIVRAFYRLRTAQWFALKRDKSAGITRLKIIVSKLVQKVEELMDIAMGLHYNLPPMAPSRPRVVETTQNAVTLAWDPPSNSLHKIRFYRITRQVYPSMTLLGDFGDVVERNGDASFVTIEGLRPGTTYQFRVCAVSRMGEGPFSVASDPVATFSLNWDGETTAGWMKYRREYVPRAKLAFLLRWIQPTFLHRYVVLDKRHLVYYKDEEVALKHRSRARRKKLKTTFLWRDVVSFELSDSKVQFDDLSPSLYCLEVTVRPDDGTKYGVKYSFQPDAAKDFPKFLSALAFAVPLEAVGDSVSAYLDEKQLPNPREFALQRAANAAADEADAPDEAASEWSSVTGDESALADQEDAEFDETSTRSLLAWRIPVYRRLYSLQNAAFQLETVQYDDDDEYEPNIGELVQLAWNVARSNTAGITCLSMILCFTAQADVLNLVFVLATFGFLILESPRPNALAWVYLLAYTYAVIALRYAFQLSVFCLQLGENGLYYPSVQPYCAASANTALIEIEPIQPTVLLGLYKFDGSALEGTASVVGGLQWNFYVLLCMMWHRRELIAQGLWLEANATNGDGGLSESGARHGLSFMSHASSHDSIDDAFDAAFDQGLFEQAAAVGRGNDGDGNGNSNGDRDRARGSPSSPTTATPAMTITEAAAVANAAARFTTARQRRSRNNFGTPSMSSVENRNDLAAEMLEELQAQEDASERARNDAALSAAAARGGDSDSDDVPDDHRASDGVGTPLNSPPPSSGFPFSLGTHSDPQAAGAAAGRKTVSFMPHSGGAAVNTSSAVDSQQVEIDDSVDLDFTPQQQKRSFWQRTFPRLCAYVDAVVCDPPAQWDKDIHIAITGEKPGWDYYTASLTLELFATVFAVLFFPALGEPDTHRSAAASAAADTRLTSSSMLSAYLVLVVVLEVGCILWDRVAYVCRSLGSKLLLQYAHALILHLSVMWLLPMHTSIYLQHRPALIVFYLLHCASLWLSALQIRYGYPAFQGSKYSDTTATTTKESSTFFKNLNNQTFGLVMAAPFLFELRALLDYVCTTTSLSWSHWVLLEDTAAHLFLVKREMRGRVANADVLQGKQRQPLKSKLLSAGVMLFVLLLCLVGPLALFSSANPSTTANRVRVTDVEMGITDAQGTLISLFVGQDRASPSISIPKNTDGASVQRLEFDAFSREIWTTSPPRINQLVTQLQASDDVLNWTMAFTFERPGPTDFQVVKATYSVALTSEHRNDLIPMIKQRVDETDEMETNNKVAIRVDGLFPPIIQLTATSGVLRRSLTMRSVNVTKHTRDGVSWWSLTPFDPTGSTRENYCDATMPFCVVAVSDNIVDGLRAIGIGSYGITAVYIFVVVTIGSAVKGFFRGAYRQVTYNELPAPEDVLELIEGIYIARNESYVGHLKDEVRIFETLIRVLRSPETLVKVTGSNVIHIPSAKEKIE